MAFRLRLRLRSGRSRVGGVWEVWRVLRLTRTLVTLSFAALALAVAADGVEVHAQVQMPDPKQMSGIPRPVDDLPGGSLSVRLIKGDLANNIKGHPVELYIDGKVQTVSTDADGRAQFDRLPPGSTLRAVAVVDGERLESQQFPAPVEGGIRLMLVATDREKEAQKAAEASAPAIEGQVVIGGESRIIIEPNDEELSIFYILEITNTARAPVNPPTPFEFDLPDGATRANVMQGSSTMATVAGTRVTVTGPFPPGVTMVQVGGVVPIGSGTLTLTQRFPASYQQPIVIAKKEGAMTFRSPQLDRQQDTVSEGTPIIVAMGSSMLAAGQPLQITLGGLVHHSRTPRFVTLTLSAIILLAGVWAFYKAPTGDVAASERKRQVARREKLLQELVRLEQDRRKGRGDAARYAARREELIASLESIYGALDADGAGPDAAAGAARA
jgi:hypothetical protein